VKAIKADLFHRTNVASASQNAAAGNPVISMKGRPRGNGNLSNVSAELLVHVLAYLILEKQERNQSPPRQYDLVGHFQVSRSTLLRHIKALGLSWTDLVAQAAQVAESRSIDDLGHAIGVSCSKIPL
jgi:hypothetical protein